MHLEAHFRRFPVQQSRILQPLQLSIKAFFDLFTFRPQNATFPPRLHTLQNPMKTNSKTFPIFCSLIVTAVLLTACNTGYRQSFTQPKMPTKAGPITTINMQLTSTAFKNNEKIPAKYTCDGQNISPPLKFDAIPENTQTLALIVDDPDAPAGTWAHWIIFNIDPKTTEIPENTSPKTATQGTNSFGKSTYGGACPPSGTHRYFFKLYALDTKLTLDQTAKKQDLETAIQGHALSYAELIGLYSRQ